jgi:CelD/BcsL family acetyltransferase involved in cellulose biosynthesis
MPETELIADLGRLAALAPEWDELAVAAGLPQMSPAWILAWWRHIAPAGAVPRTVAVRDGGRLVGLAPYYVELGGGGRVDYRLPGIELAGRLEPLALHGREWEVAEAVGRALMDATPRPDALLLEAAPIDGQWSIALRDTWPGALRPPLWVTLVDGSPFISLSEPTFEEWLAGRGSNLRRQMRRMRRKFEEAGGTVRVATHDTLAQDADTFAQLHAARWEGRGTTNLVALGERFTAFLRDAGGELLATSRLTILTLELGGEPIAGQLLISAGGTALAVNGGWDERHARLRPASLCMLYTVELLYARGERRLDLGVGEQEHKLRFADGNAPLLWGVLMAPGARLPLTAARTAPTLAQARLRESARRMLSERQVERLRTARQRLRGAR